MNRIEYKGVKLDSSWELDLAMWLDEKRIRWTRPASIPWTDKLGKKRKYFPDFYLPDADVYLDPKNPVAQKLQQEKLSVIHRSITLLVGTPDEIRQKLRLVLEDRVGFEPTYWD